MLIYDEDGIHIKRADGVHPLLRRLTKAEFDQCFKVEHTETTIDGAAVTYTARVTQPIGWRYYIPNGATPRVRRSTLSGPSWRR